jgi:hypothetical protein
VTRRRRVQTDRTIPARRVRSFTLRPAKIAALKAQVDGTSVPNPFNTGFYFFLIDALKQLGVNRTHPIRHVIGAFRQMANAPSTYKNGGTFWKRWKHKDAARPWRDRFVQNIEVLQRVARPGVQNRSAYGQKLKQVGTEVLGSRGVVIDMLRARDGKMLVKLNTNSPFPINEFRTRRDQSRSAVLARFRQQRHVAQAGRCAICPREGRLCVDHCHTRNRLRGLLCRKCNLGLGQFDDSPMRVMRAALYLMEAMGMLDEPARTKTKSTKGRRHE